MVATFKITTNDKYDLQIVMSIAIYKFQIQFNVKYV